MKKRNHASTTAKSNKRRREEEQTTDTPQYGSKEYWEARYKSHLPDADVQQVSRQSDDEAGTTNTGNQEEKYVLDGVELSKEAINAGHAWYFTYDELRPLILPLIFGGDGDEDVEDEYDNDDDGDSWVEEEEIVVEEEEENDLEGTLILWPGIAEELVASKAWFVRDGMFNNIDACIFTHVSSNMGVSWGASRGTGLISVEFTFEGDAAHAAGAPWRGKSAADAVELMNIGWNYKREHLDPLKRSHSIISDGGDQPNVVPSKSSIWYYFRDVTYEGIMEMYESAKNIAEGAALMTDTKMSYKILGTAWPRHFNKSIAETMYKNIETVGLPEWSEDDQTLAKAVQQELGNKTTPGLASELNPIGLPVEKPVSGGSDDIGDVSWTLPTVTLRFPSNIPGLPGHHWSNAIAMATPIAHKGVTAGAQVEAMTLIEMLTKPSVLEEAWAYFNEEQTKETKYQPMIEATTEAPTYLNTEIDERFRPALSKYFYNEKKYDSYLEQLGVNYPTLKKED